MFDGRQPLLTQPFERNDGNVVVRFSPRGVAANGFGETVEHRLRRHRTGLQRRLHGVHAELRVFLILRFGHAVGEQHDGIARFEHEGEHFVLIAVDDAEREAGHRGGHRFLEAFLGVAIDEGRDVAGVDAGDLMTDGVENAGAQRHEPIENRGFLREFVESSDGDGEALLRERAETRVGTDFRHDQRGRHAFARDVAHHRPDPRIRQRNEVVVVAAHFLGRFIMRAEFVAGQDRHVLRQETLLHLLRQLKIALQSGPGDQTFMHPSVLDRHRRLTGDGKQQLEIVRQETLVAVERVELDHAERFVRRRIPIQERSAHDRANLAVGDALA